MKSLRNVVLFFFILSLFSCSEKASTVSIKTLMADRVAGVKVKAKQYEEALSLYVKILETDPELPEIHSNIGILFLTDKKNEEALKSLLEALRLAETSQNKKAEFIIRYNLGVYFGIEKKVPEALENYQAALEIVPTSKETKHNIELLIQNGSNQSKDGDKKDQDQKGQGDSKDDKKDGSGQDKKKQPDNKNDSSGNDKKDEKDKDNKDKDKQQSPQDVKQSPKYKPRPFQGDQLSEGDVKKILGELRSQEQKIRANYDKKERKEQKNDKDW